MHRVLLKKPILLLLISFFYIHATQAQDGIVLLNGDTIFTHILKVTAAEITFHNPQNRDSVSTISTDLAEKLIYANGRVEKIYHADKKNDNLKNTTDSKMMVRKGNTYYYKGEYVTHEELEFIYVAMHDETLTKTYYKGMNMKRGSKTLIYVTVPLGAAGFLLTLYSTFPTNLSRRNGGDVNYGNENLVVPGTILIGSALLSSISGVIIHNIYKNKLEKAANRYNILISNQ